MSNKSIGSKMKGALWAKMMFDRSRIFTENLKRRGMLGEQ